MATPSKKQAPEQQHTEEQPAPIMRLLACDDHLGKVYSSCEDSATRHALRVSCSACYRSPAINSFLDFFELEPQTTVEDATSALAAFPRPARLKYLVINHSKLHRLLLILLGPAGSAARTKLQNVNHVTIKDCKLDSPNAAALALLFPALRTGDESSLRLTGDNAVLTGEALGVMACQVCIKELRLEMCRLPNHLQVLTSFGSLRSLVLDTVKSPGPFSLEPLCPGIPSAGPLLQLTKLEVRYLKDVTGLNECLARHPLQELLLKGISFPPSMASLHLASPTLRVMRMWLNLSFPDISVANFPALRLLEIEGIDLGQIPGVNAEESVQRCSRLASSIAEFPCVQCTNGLDENDDQFMILGNTWPPAQFLELLQALAPLRASFRGVQSLDFVDSNIGNGAMHTVATPFPSLALLYLSTIEEVVHHTYSDGFGLSEAVQLLDLKELEIVCERVPRDTIMALANAREGFVLRLVATNDGCRQRLDEVKMQWDTVRMVHQDAPRLEVGTLGEDEEEHSLDVPEAEP